MALYRRKPVDLFSLFLQTSWTLVWSILLVLLMSFGWYYSLVIFRIGNFVFGFYGAGVLGKLFYDLYRARRNARKIDRRRVRALYAMERGEPCRGVSEEAVIDSDTVRALACVTLVALLTLIALRAGGASCARSTLGAGVTLIALDALFALEALLSLRTSDALQQSYFNTLVLKADTTDTDFGVQPGETKTLRPYIQVFSWKDPATQVVREQSAEGRDDYRSFTKAVSSTTAVNTLPMILITADAPVPAGSSVTQAILRGTQLGRFKVTNMGWVKATVEKIALADYGTHTGTSTLFDLVYSDQNSTNYTQNSVGTQNNLIFNNTSISIDGGAYRYITVVLKALMTARAFPGGKHTIFGNEFKTREGKLVKLEKIETGSRLIELLKEKVQIELPADQWEILRKKFVEMPK
jgi:hypothetical protein